MGRPVRVIVLDLTDRVKHVIRLRLSVGIALERCDVEAPLAAARLLETTLEGLRALPRVV